MLASIDATLPCFIPAPSFIGTFGAFIKKRSPLMDRRTLLDAGAASPLAGMIAAVPVLFIGLILSEIVPETGERGIKLGTSIFFPLLNWIVHGFIPEDTNLILHPIAFPGWIGLLATCLNLLPVGQIDGGYMAYAIVGSIQGTLAREILPLLLVLVTTGGSGWLAWAVILLFMGLDHPPLVYEGIPLDKKRKNIVWITLALFVMTSTPVPF